MQSISIRQCLFHLILANVCVAASTGPALTNPTVDVPNVYCDALGDRLWAQSDRRRTFQSDFSDILETLQYCERRAITDDEIIALALDALLLAVLAKNDMKASHNFIPPPSPENEAAGQAIGIFAQHLVRYIDPEIKDPDGAYVARLMYNFMSISIRDGENLGLGFSENGFGLLKRQYGSRGSGDIRKNHIRSLRPYLWPQHVSTVED